VEIRRGGHALCAEVAQLAFGLRSVAVARRAGRHPIPARDSDHPVLTGAAPKVTDARCQVQRDDLAGCVARWHQGSAFAVFWAHLVLTVEDAQKGAQVRLLVGPVRDLVLQRAADCAVVVLVLQLDGALALGLEPLARAVLVPMLVLAGVRWDVQYLARCPKGAAPL
jgi:hypothetical protein